MFGGNGATRILLPAMEGYGGVASPLRFQTSVHNAPAGQLSMATANQGFSTTVSAGAETVAMSFVEAVGLLVAGHPDVLVVVADEGASSMFSPDLAYPPMAGAFWLKDGAGEEGALDDGQVHQLLNHPAEGDVRAGLWKPMGSGPRGATLLMGGDSRQESVCPGDAHRAGIPGQGPGDGGQPFGTFDAWQSPLAPVLRLGVALEVEGATGSP